MLDPVADAHLVSPVAGVCRKVHEGPVLSVDHGIFPGLAAIDGHLDLEARSQRHRQRAGDRTPGAAVGRGQVTRDARVLAHARDLQQLARRRLLDADMQLGRLRGLLAVDHGVAVDLLHRAFQVVEGGEFGRVRIVPGLVTGGVLHVDLLPAVGGGDGQQAAAGVVGRGNDLATGVFHDQLVVAGDAEHTAFERDLAQALLAIHCDLHVVAQQVS
ncbi:hypothetical protein D9M72_535060 [compost metagenome]